MNLNCSYEIWETYRKKLKMHSISNIGLTFQCLLNCSTDLKIFANSQPSASNFKSFSRSLEHFFLALGQNNFGNKISLPKEKKNIYQLKNESIFRSMNKGKERWQLNLNFFRKNILDTWMNVKQGDAAIGYLLLKHTFSNFFVSIKGFWMM